MLGARNHDSSRLLLCSSCHSLASCQVTIAGINFVTGFCAVIASYIMKNLDETREVNKVLVHVYRLFPPYNLGEGLITLSARKVSKSRHPMYTPSAAVTSRAIGVVRKEFLWNIWQIDKDLVHS